MTDRVPILVATFPVGPTGPHLWLRALIDDDRFQDAFDAQVWHVPDLYRGMRGKLSLLWDARDARRSSGARLVYLNLDMSLAFWLCIAFRLAGAEVQIAHSHNSHFSSPAGRWQRFLYKCGISWITDVHAAVCEGSAKAMFLGNPAHVLLVPSCIDFDALHRCAASQPVRKRTSGDRYVFGCVGRLMAQKNQALVIRALAGLQRAGNDVELLLVGEGEDRSRLEGLAESEGVVDRVVFAGTTENIGEVFRGRIDALLLPSLYEGQVRTAAEAQSFGLPIAVSEHIAKVALLDDVGVIGGLPLEVSAWESAMLRLMGMPRGSERSLGELNQHRLSLACGAARFYQVLVENVS